MTLLDLVAELERYTAIYGDLQVANMDGDLFEQVGIYMPDDPILTPEIKLYFECDDIPFEEDDLEV